MVDDNLIGEIIHLMSAATFPWTVEQLGAMPSDMVKALDIDSGEHIAAILVSAFLGATPVAVDVDGGVDLLFTSIPHAAAGDVGCDDVVTSACFEVKSMSGDFRRFFNQRSTQIGDSHSTTVKTLEDLVESAQREIQRAADSQVEDHGDPVKEHRDPGALVRTPRHRGNRARLPVAVPT